MRRPITRPVELTPEQAARLDETGEAEGPIRKAAWYRPALELAVRYLWILVCGMALFIFNGYNDAQSQQAAATKELAKAIGGLQNEQVRLRTQLESLADAMRTQSHRQETAISSAERAIDDLKILRARVELLQYYVLEFDGKLIAAGIVAPKDSVALKLRKQEEGK